MDADPSSGRGMHPASGNRSKRTRGSFSFAQQTDRVKTLINNMEMSQ